MTRIPGNVAFVLLVAAGPAPAVTLPDTGQDICYNDSAADTALATNADSVARDSGSHPRQDCRYGRDAAAAIGAIVKTGKGVKGFDYTKIANISTPVDPGTALGTGAFAWACTLDNVTGLMWEVKTGTATDLRYYGHRYSWYNTDGSSNGGNAGNVGLNTCNATLPGSQCNTQAFVAAVNTASLCTYTDWRLPTRRELQTLQNYDGTTPSIAPTYFAVTPTNVGFWTSSSYVPSAASAWGVSFDSGFTFSTSKTNTSFVRLVRGGPF